MELDLITMISNMGFPIAIAAFLLLKSDNTNKELITAINSLTKIISHCDNNSYCKKEEGKPNE